MTKEQVIEHLEDIIESCFDSPVYFEHQQLEKYFVLSMCTDQDRIIFPIKIQFENTTIEKYTKAQKEKTNVFDKKLQTAVNTKKA